MIFRNDIIVGEFIGTMALNDITNLLALHITKIIHVYILTARVF